MQKLYKLSGWRNKERTVPQYFETTDENQARQVYAELSKNGTPQMEVKPFERTEQARQNALALLGLGKP